MALSLLLADDKPAIAKIISLSLPREEFRVESVATGREALERIEASAPYFLLLDASLPFEKDGSHPEKDGIFITRHIKSHPALKDIHIVLLTNAFEPIDDNKCKEYGADGVLVKPFDPSELRSRLKSLIRSDEARKPSLEVAATASPSIPIAPPLPDSDNVSIDLGFSDFGNTSPAPADFQFEVDEPTAAPEIPPNLSPAAKELAGFFAKEIATNTGIARPDVIEFGAPAISIEPEDFSKAADEWKPKHPNVGESLTDWQSKSTVDETFFRPQETASMGEGIFDLGGSNFEFSDDYILKLGTGLPFAQPTPAAIAPATNVREINRPAAAEPKTTTPAPARPQMLERAEMEALVREEARKVCQDIVDKIAWEVIPELAENIIRRELDRVLAELDKENPPRN